MDNTNYLNNFIQPVADDITFWRVQISEHALFLSNLLNPNTAYDLKREATQFYMRSVNSQTQMTRGTYDVNFMSLFYAFLETVHNKIPDIPDINLVLSLDDFHDLVKHMILEHTYVVRLLGGQMTVKEELLFWLQENAEHMTLVSNLLPQGQLKEDSGRIADALRCAHNASLHDHSYLLTSSNVVRASIEAASLVNNEIISGRVNIDQQMLLHEIRESNRSLDRINSLLKGMA